MTNREARSAEEVEAAVEHVCYELRMMVLQLDEAERARTSGRADQYVVNALFEAGLLHARNLIEFLTFKSKGTKMHPNDFGSTSRGTLRDREFDKLVNRHLSHLLWERVTEPLGVWPDLRPLVEDLLALFGDFVRSTPDPASFEPCLREAREIWSARRGARAGLADMTTASTEVIVVADFRTYQRPES